jgi:hypothetical protein
MAFKAGYGVKRGCDLHAPSFSIFFRLRIETFARECRLDVPEAQTVGVHAPVHGVVPFATRAVTLGRFSSAATPVQPKDRGPRFVCQSRLQPSQPQWGKTYCAGASGTMLEKARRVMFMAVSDPRFSSPCSVLPCCKSTGGDKSKTIRRKSYRIDRARSRLTGSEVRTP